MANVDFRLGEWFRQVEKREKELKAKRTTVKGNGHTRSEPRADEKHVVLQPTAERVANRVSPLVVRAIEDAGDGSGVGQVREHTTGLPQSGVATISQDDGPEVLEDDAIPQVEDFIPMETRRPEVSARIEDFVDDSDEVETDIIDSAEGTGTPRPLDSAQVVTAAPKPATPAVRAQPKPKNAPQPSTATQSLEHDRVEAAWNRMPHHLQVLFGVASEEVAQRSYSAFKESRDEMIQRLVDPTLTLEETARLLNVCPTTVRRYTNRGVLRHHRTAGNQRRFRLSDVLGFVEAQNGG